MFQPSSAVKLGNTPETPAFLALVAWLRSRHILFGATLKTVPNSQDPNISQADNFVENTFK